MPYPPRYNFFAYPTRCIIEFVTGRIRAFIILKFFKKSIFSFFIIEIMTSA